MKIIVAHEGKQHSFYTAQALYNEGMLYKYITTVYYRKGNWTYFISRFLRGKTLEKCKSHRIESIPEEYIIQFSEWKGLLMLFLKRIPWLWNLFPIYYDWLHDSFGEKVAKYAIKNHVDVVIMYDTNANRCWEILKEKAPQIKRVLDVSIANRLYLKSVYEEDIRLCGNQELRKEQKEIWDPRNIRRYEEELENSQYYLAGSSFVKQSLMFSNVRPDKIFVVPYGVDTCQFKMKTNKNISLPLKVIFVGQISYRKGIHHLLNVVSSFQPNELELHILGAYDSTQRYYLDYSKFENIHFEGFVTRNQIARFYQDADVFCLPSLGEGLALVILEALGSGIPCVVSSNSGGSDVIVSGKNGYVFEAGDDSELKRILTNIVNNPLILKEMGENALTSITNYRWDNYFKNLNNIVTQICDDSCP